jgi:phage/plasmid-like protein (TIGR03299 family)
MSHENSTIGNANGEAFYAFVPAWHGLGTVIQEAPTWERAIGLASLDWTVEQFPLRATIETFETPDGEVPAVTREVPGMVGNYRSDTGTYLGVVSDRYSIINNVDAFKFLDALVDDGSLRYESAGALRDGKVVWMLARMPERDVIAEGDDLDRYLLFTTTHDGSGAAKVLPTSVRVVCNNTLSIALDRSQKVAMSIHHTGDVAEKIARARAVIEMSGGLFGNFAETARKLAGVKITDDQFATYLDEVVPEPSAKAPPVTGDKVRKAREVIRVNWNSDPRQQIKPIAFTAWAAVNAVTQQQDHQTDRTGKTDKARAEARFNAAFFEAGHKVKTRAVEVAEAMFLN